MNTLTKNVESLFDFRELSPGDLSSVYDLEMLTFEHSWSESLIKSELEKEDNFNLGIFIDTKLVSYLIANMVVDEFHLLKVAVHPDFQRQGYARALLREALKRAKFAGVKSAFLEVRTSNSEAIFLYRSANFKLSSVRRNYYRDNNEDAFIFEKELK